MSLASASPRPTRASLDPDVIHISTSPLPASPRPSMRRRHQPMQPPVSTSSPLPPAQSSSPRHHAHVSSAAARSTRQNSSNNNNPSTPSRLRHASPSRLVSQQLADDAAAAAAYAVTDQVFINELLREEFSSPSTYPSFTNPAADDDSDDDEFHDGLPDTQAVTTQTSDCMGRANEHGADLDQSSGPSAATTQNTDFSFNDTQPSQPFLDELLQEQGEPNTAAIPYSEGMLATRRRAAANALESNTLPPLKKQKASQTELKREKTAKTNLQEDLFGDLVEVPTTPSADAPAEEEMTTIDLTEATEVPQELREPIVDNRIKISAFQCAICMDDVTGLTVTYCGHLFCAQCLHSSLAVETTKGRCPMCRAKIDMKPRDTYTTKTKGFWPLELKLMTTTRKGKRKADDISN